MAITEQALTSPLNSKNWLDKCLKGRLQHKEGSGGNRLRQRGPEPSAWVDSGISRHLHAAGLTEVHLKAFLGDIYQTQ